MKHRLVHVTRAKRIVLLAVCLTLVSALAAAKPAKYVFFMIGDGLAGVQRAAAEYYKYSQEHEQTDRAGISKLVMNTFPAHGMTTTFAENAIITDSAAAGTALACGKKTLSGVVAMDAGKQRSLKTLVDIAQAKGMKTGIVSSVSIDHATPACFYAHSPDRGEYWKIAMQLANSDIDYFGGGQAKGALAGKRRDRNTGKLRTNPVEAARENDFRIATTRKELNACKPGEKVWAFNHTVDRSAALYYEMDRPDDHLSLLEFTRKGIDLLDNDRGFFMMVEGGKIDWACHANDAVAAIHDTLEFDRCVKAAYEFYKQHPEETLVVVTGDHECGGMTLGFAGTRYGSFPEKLARQTMSYQQFNEVVEEFRKNKTSFDNALPVIKKAFGFKKLSAFERDQIRRAFAASMKGKKERAMNEAVYLQYGSYEPLTVKCTHVLDRQAGIAWTSYSHTGVPVPTSAIGTGAERFNGYYDNTDIFHKMRAAMTGAAAQTRRQPLAR